MEKGELYRIITPVYVVGVIVQDRVIIDAAPIVKWCTGKRFMWTVEKIRNTYPTMEYQKIN